METAISSNPPGTGGGSSGAAGGGGRDLKDQIDHESLGSIYHIRAISDYNPNEAYGPLTTVKYNNFHKEGRAD